MPNRRKVASALAAYSDRDALGLAAKIANGSLGPTLRTPVARFVALLPDEGERPEARRARERRLSAERDARQDAMLREQGL